MKGKKVKNNNGEKLFAFVLFTIACVLGFIHYNRAYEKGSDR